MDWDELLFRAYLFWTPHKWLSLTAEYQYEEFDRDEEFTAGVKDLDTHRVPLGINFFHPSGFSASVKGTYFYQDGKFEQAPPPGNFVNDDDNFWLVDAAISYRLPKRYGFITLGAKNLLNEEDFNYEDTDVNNPAIQPDRTVFGRITLAFP